MLLFSLFLFPVILATDQQLNFGKYIATVTEDNTLLGIEKTSNESLPEVNLSSLGLENIAPNAFNNVTNIRRLKLANNWLTTLPKYFFANFTNLEELSLADNKISTLDRVFINLYQLQTLDLSNNLFDNIGGSYLYGLNRYVDVLIKGNDISSISTNLFQRPYGPKGKYIDKDKKSQVTDNSSDSTIGNFTSLQVCKNPSSSDHILYVKNLQPSENMTDNCDEVRVDHSDMKLSLRGRTIRKFSKDWYQVKNLPIRSLDLVKTRIEFWKPEILNDLPENIVEIDMSNNSFWSWNSGIIENSYIRTLIFDHCYIKKIDDDFFAKTNLTVLSLNYNGLTNTDFASTLPSSLEEIRLSHNEIGLITNASFSRLTKLVKIDFSYNQIQKMEAGFFGNFKALRELNLYATKLMLYKGIFEGLRKIEYLNIGMNNLRNITKDTLFAMPDTLKTVILDYNEIESLEIGSFLRVPKYKLSLVGNNITRIVKGSFDLPTLTELDLGNNRLTIFDSNSFKGLANLSRLSLANNNLRKLERLVLKYLGNLEVLDLSMNPIRELTKGALNGMVKSQNGAILLSGVPLEHFQGDVFEEY